MILRSLETDDIPVVSSWLADEQNHRWLDFGGGRQVLAASALKIMAQRDLHLLRVYALETGGPPVGLVALSDVDRSFRTARLWYVLGEKRLSRQGLTTRAVSRLLGLGFTTLELGSVNAWVVEDNRPSVRVLERNGFRRIGRQRKCHSVDGRLRDRILYDLLAEEYRPI